MRVSTGVRVFIFGAGVLLGFFASAPKALAQVPNLDHYHVIVALAKEAEKAFPPKPRKVVFLDWNVADPSRVKGSAAEITAAYEATYSFLQDHIKDLVEAVLGDED